jgi:hypothetical protein
MDAGGEELTCGAAWNLYVGREKSIIESGVPHSLRANTRQLGTRSTHASLSSRLKGGPPGPSRGSFTSKRRLAVVGAAFLGVLGIELRVVFRAPLSAGPVLAASPNRRVYQKKRRRKKKTKSSGEKKKDDTHFTHMIEERARNFI